MAANLFEHPWIVVIIAAVAIIRWFLQAKPAAGDTEKTPPPPREPIQRGSETQTEEERIRRFLEALGRPAGAAPPKEVTPRRKQVVPQIFRTPLPPLTTTPPPLPAKPSIRPATPPPLPIELAIPRELSKLEIGFEVRDVVQQTSSEPPPAVPRAASFAGRIKFGTPQDLRTAIVLREIFGPPRSLQPVDLTNS